MKIRDVFSTQRLHEDGGLERSNGHAVGSQTAATAEEARTGTHRQRKLQHLRLTRQPGEGGNILPPIRCKESTVDCKTETPRLEIETEDAIYEIEFGQVQVEITGRCNMRCAHCRAAHQPQQDMPIAQIEKIIRFARRFSPNYKEVVLSGGEPLLHRSFAEVLRRVRANGGEFVTLTTNGALLTTEHLALINNTSFKRFTLSVSLDSLNAEEHDRFRAHRGAFPKAVAALRLIAESGMPNVVASMRSTIQAAQIGEMERMVEFARTLGCKRVSFSAIHPAGRAIERSDLWMTRAQKVAFLKEVYRLKSLYQELNVTTNDPLKCLLRGKNDVGNDGELVFDGCGAGAITFNVNADGIMTPCALLNLPMMSVFPLTIEEITENYRQNPIVRNILAMNLGGKCGTCRLKYQCGGCRARALIQNDDYLAEDPHCWL